MANNTTKLSKEDIKKLNKDNPKPEKKKNVPMITIRTIEVIIALCYIIILAFGKLFIPENLEFFQSFNIFSGANPVPNARLLGLALFVIIIGTLVRICLKLLGKKPSIKKVMSVAVLQLLSNLVKYIIIIIVFCFFLSACGVDTVTILAGLGIFALIIGLGVTSLIEDIVAGIFIIAEHTFDIGDIIVVDGFRGSVVSIGIRSTKLADVGGDILTLRNSSIGSVINLTDRQSCAAITFPIAPEETLEHVEEVIKNGSIDKIQETCDKMLGAPIYLGLCEITSKGVQMLLFIAACKEDHRYDVERALYHGLKLLFDNNGVKLGNPGPFIEE
jgi:small conductance mechanosensitive channel